MKTHPNTTTNILNTAAQAHAQGISIIPIAPATPQRSKTPPFPWKKYQQTPATLQQIIDWYTTHPEWGIAAITGKASNNLEMIELEADAIHLTNQIHETAQTLGAQHLWEKINTGWSEITPTGGIHYYYHINGTVPGNQKLARNPQGKILAETRGEGGLTVIAPTPGTCHPNGQPWEPYMGGPTTTPTLTPEEATLIRRIFKTLDQTPTHAPTPANTTPTTTTTDNGTPPGQDYENKTTWHDILTPHGWTPINTQGTTTYWRRPGKNDGISATTGHAQDRERLYVFSTNTPFQAETPYTKFGAYTTLNHAGNHTNAAKQLAKEGYGTPTTRPITNIQEWQTHKHTTTTTTAVTPQPENNGTTSLAPITPLPTPTTQTLAYTDDANALELIDTHGHTIRHATDQDRWYTWNGHTWQPQPASGGTVRELAKNIARNMPTTNKEETAWKKRTLSAPGITALLTQAATDPRTTTKTTNFDNNPYLLNTPQGTIDLRTSQTHEHNPLNYCTKTTTCHPQPGTPTKWLKFLADTFQQNPELIDYMQTLTGYALTGLTQDHILPFLFGDGANGKSVQTETTLKIMGDYAQIAPIQFLMVGAPQHETSIARLKGARLVICSEVSESSKFDEAKAKMLTGGDRLTARHMHKDYIEFEPTHKLWIAGNHKPRVSAGGHSFWRRLRLIPYSHTVPEQDRIQDLATILVQEEGPQILAWMIDGAKQYLDHGLPRLPALEQATEEYADEEDTIGRFIEDCLIVGGGEYARVLSRDMTTAYKNWCDSNGCFMLSMQRFGREIGRHGVEKYRSGGKRFYSNVSLAADALPGIQDIGWWQK